MPRMHYHINMDEFEQLWRQGVLGCELATRYGISASHVTRLRKRYGIPDRREEDLMSAPTAADDSASQDSLAFSPWVASRIKELGLGMPAKWHRGSSL